MVVVIRTHDAGLLQKALQTVLSYRGRWLPEVAGWEWYATNPDEIVRLYDLMPKTCSRVSSSRAHPTSWR